MKLLDRCLFGVTCLLALLMLQGCAAPIRPDGPAHLLADHLFPDAPAPAVGRDGILALSPAMRRFVDTELLPRSHRLGARDALLEALGDANRLRLVYDSGATRTAAQAFDARAGNCLSLVMMTAALAQALDVPVEYQQVQAEETWSRAGDLLLASSHVNLRLGRPLMGPRPISTDPVVVVDFLPPQQARRLRARPIAEATVVAMYMNNRAVETLTDGHGAAAYGWVREAVRTDPRWLPAYNTLAVIYRRHGDDARAERTLREVLAIEPANLQALANLASLLRPTQPAEAEQLARRLAALQPEPPFHHLDRGLAALGAADYNAARAELLQELQRDAYAHETHFALALAYRGLGQHDRARRHLLLAQEYSTSQRERSRYAAKVEALRRQ